MLLGGRSSTAEGPLNVVQSSGTEFFQCGFRMWLDPIPKPFPIYQLESSNGRFTVGFAVQVCLMHQAEVIRQQEPIEEFVAPTSGPLDGRRDSIVR